MTKRKSARGGGSRGKGKQSTGDRVPHPVAENEDPPEEEEEAGPEEAEETEEKDAPSAGFGRKRAGRGGGAGEQEGGSVASATADDGAEDAQEEAEEEGGGGSENRPADGGADQRPAETGDESSKSETEPPAKRAKASAEDEKGPEKEGTEDSDNEKGGGGGGGGKEHGKGKVEKEKEGEKEAEEVDSGPALILTGTTIKRSLYECDYCKQDVTHVPRVRCAVCPDFDLCLDCFATTDPTAALSSRAAHEAARAVREDEAEAAAEKKKENGMAGDKADVKEDREGGDNSGEEDNGGDGRSSSSSPTSAPLSQGYRVSDSARFPMFPTARGVTFKVQKSIGGGGVGNEGQEEGNGDTAKADADADASTAMEVDDDPENYATPTLTVTDEPRAVWTAEEDLRLLDAIAAYGLGNWTDISEAVSGSGAGGFPAPPYSSNKTARRCMERYFDDFLGRYGCILPPYTLVEDDNGVAAGRTKGGEQNGSGKKVGEGGGTADASAASAAASTDPPSSAPKPDASGDASSTSNSAAATPMASTSSDPPGRKRRRESASASILARQLSAAGAGSAIGFTTDKKYRVTTSESLPGYGAAWPHPYLPDLPNIKIGDEVGRDLAVKAEQEFVKLMAAAQDKEKAERIRSEWTLNRLQKPGGPTVLPMRLENLETMPGSELAGYMPRRGDFDVEWDNDAEHILAEMEFSADDSAHDRALKVQICEIYCSKLDERERRKKFLTERNLLDYRRNQAKELALPPDERDLVNRMRLFARFHSPEEHDKFIQDLLKAKRLRKEISRLQQYRRMGITTLTEAEKYELDRERREHHKIAHSQKEAEDQKALKAASASGNVPPVTLQSAREGSTLWKEYRSDRRSRDRKSAKRDLDAPAVAVMVSGNEAEKNSYCKDISGSDEEKHTNMDVNSQAEKESDATSEFCVEDKPGFDLLIPNEARLCERLTLLPQLYLEVKKALISESLREGIISKDGSSSRSMVKIDVEKRDDVIDFVLRAGWIPKN